MEKYLKRANELKLSVEGNFEHSTDIQDYELVEWLIEQAEKIEKINLLVSECNNSDRAVQPYEILNVLRS